MSTDLFIDAGANQGDISRWWLSHVPSSSVLAIEAQASLIPHLRLVLDPTRAKVLHAAAWTHNTGISLFLTDPEADPQRVGATVCEGKTTNRVNYAQGVHVPSVDMTQLALESRIATAGVLVLKLDIEGAEYAVLERLLARGAMLLLDALIVETHVHKVRSISSQRHDALLAALCEWAGEPVAQHTTWRAYMPRHADDRGLQGILHAMLAADTRSAAHRSVAN